MVKTAGSRKKNKFKVAKMGNKQSQVPKHFMGCCHAVINVNPTMNCNFMEKLITSELFLQIIQPSITVTFTVVLFFYLNCYSFTPPGLKKKSWIFCSLLLFFSCVFFYVWYSWFYIFISLSFSLFLLLFRLSVSAGNMLFDLAWKHHYNPQQRRVSPVMPLQKVKLCMSLCVHASLKLSLTCLDSMYLMHKHNYLSFADLFLRAVLVLAACADKIK